MKISFFSNDRKFKKDVQSFLNKSLILFWRVIMELRDKKVLTSFDPRASNYVAVVGTGSKQHLEMCHVRFGLLGRLLRRLGIAYRGTDPRRVAAYIAKHMGSWSNTADDFPAVEQIVRKLQKFQQRRPKELVNPLRQIEPLYDRMVVAYKVAHNLPIKPEDKFQLLKPDPKRPDLTYWNTVNPTPEIVKRIQALDGAGIAALKTDVLENIAELFLDSQIPSIPPSIISATLLNKWWKTPEKVPLFTELQLRNISNTAFLYSDIIKALTPGQVASIQDCLDSGWCAKMQSSQLQQIDWDKVTPQLLHDLRWVAKDLTEAQIKPALNKMSVEQFKDLERQANANNRLYHWLTPEKLREYQPQLGFHFWDSFNEELVGKLDLTQFDDYNLNKVAPRASAAQLASVFERLTPLTIKSLPPALFTQIDFAPIILKLSRDQCNALFPLLPPTITLQLDFDGMDNDQINRYATFASAAQLEKHFNRLYPDTIVLLSSAKLQKIDFVPFAAALEKSPVKLNHLFLKLSSSQLDAMPLNLFKLVSDWGLNMNQLKELSPLKQQVIPIRTVQQWLLKFDFTTTSIVDQFSVTQIQGLYALLFERKSITNLGTRLSDLKLDQIFDCCNIMLEQDLRNCGKTKLEAFLNDPRSSQYVYSGVARRIKQLLGRASAGGTPPGGTPAGGTPAGGTPAGGGAGPVKLPHKDHEYLRGVGSGITYFGIPPKLELKTFSTDTSEQGKAAHVTIARLYKMCAREITPSSLEDFYHNLLKDLVAAKIQRFIDLEKAALPDKPSAKKIYYTLSLCFQPDKHVGNPMVSKFAELYGHFPSSLKPH